MKKLLLTLFNHERYQSLSIIAACCVLVWMSSCSPKCGSILEPGKQITRTELDGEIALLQSRIDTELKNLEQQEAIRTLLLNLAKTYTTTGTFDVMSALTACLGLVGTGAVIDNVRKRRDVSRLEIELNEKS